MRARMIAIAARISTKPITANVSLNPNTSAWRLTVLPSAMIACWRAAVGSATPWARK
jgi:hypothetical protein